ncbi:MAG TPA: ferritin family protein [candidate division Zixibacteria bacterium]|nr:ferritin family protein [candidate division Zixibacteria bacterium]MDD4916983.1 ferritin family protein [candidate division Zixibacteria bacterium]MDM7972626.1 ferritin family protein [candidate division Zixibacteria bacterium]HOD67011.1 ferritin family protein [candidate division Zixibacteria bacterium]HOZ07883.1 ferritin family protein [candidate division Zixibacteria bacterium]
MRLKTAREILDFAIQKEQEAADFYNDLAERVDRPGMKSVFKGFAKEELGHKAKLESVKAGNRMLAAEKKILDLKIGDHLVEVDLRPDLSYQEALIIAMKAEKAAFKLYHDLAGTTDDPALREMLLGLAQEEAKHKLRFEIEYDDQILIEN